MSGPASPPRSPPAPSFRGVGNVHLCVLLILGIGFVLIFSYQSEVHRLAAVGGRRDGSGRPLAIHGSHYGKAIPYRRNKPEHHLNATESKSPKTKRPRERRQSGGSLSSTHQFRNGSVLANTTSLSPPSNSSWEDDANTPPKKLDWKNHKIEEYKPLVESVESNTISSKFRFVIKVLALNNYSSLVRCLGSLANAEYTNDVVDIHIYIDHFEISEPVVSHRRLLSSTVQEGGEVEKSNGEVERSNGEVEKSKGEVERSKGERARATSRSGFGHGHGQGHVPDRIDSDSVESSDWGKVELKLEDARRVVSCAESFQWKHGKKIIHYSTRTVGSQRQWVDAWWPSSDDEFALFVEDDVELSPLFYRYSRGLIATYHYKPSYYDPSLYGISLQRAQIVPGKNGLPLRVDRRTRLFKYQMVGMWGQIFFPKPWKEFREWFDSKKSHKLKPVVDGIVTTDWYTKYGEKIFTPWFVKFAYSRGYFNLYTNFLQDRVLSVTHRDIAGKSQKYAGCDSDLVGKNGTYNIDLWHMAAPWHIKRYDYCFKKVPEGRYGNTSSDWTRLLRSASNGKEQILMVSTMGVPHSMVKNWLCRVRELGIENYVLVGEDSKLLEDLARRGHATMSIAFSLEFREDIEKEARVVSDVLRLGYSVWFTRADTVWIGNPLEGANTDGEDVMGLDNSELNLFFIRSAKDTIRLWGALVQDLLGASVSLSEATHSETAMKNFVESLKEQGNLTISSLQQMTFIDGNSVSEPTALNGSQDVQVVIFSDIKSSSDLEIQTKLGGLGLWNLDDDLACARLIC